MQYFKFFGRGSLAMAMAGVWLGIALLGVQQSARGELRWENAKKEPIRVRLVALAWNHQRSSYFASEEIFIAEKQLGQDESRLVKLVYGFLPYQPRLSEAGFEYSRVYELRAMRDPDCDEPLSQITSGRKGDWRQANSDLKYSTDAPPLNLRRSKSNLPCYLTDPEDYRRSVQKPVKESPRPKLAVR